MTCAHIVNVALNKQPGVESVNVSLNQARATVKLKPGNTISVPQLWQLLRDKGYTPKSTIVSVRGDLVELQGGLQLKVSGTNDVITLAPDPKNALSWSVATAKVGQKAVVTGQMVPAKDLKASVPLTVNLVK
jgi:hypothetical protein